MKPTVSLAMYSHVSRREIRKSVLASLGADIPVVEDAVGKGTWNPARAAWLMHEDADWHGVIEDDVGPCANLVPSLPTILSGMGDCCVSLFTMSALTRKARERGCAWVRQSSTSAGLFLLLPGKHIRPFIDWMDNCVDVSGRMCESVAVTMYCLTHNLPVMISAPSIVEHLLPGGSLIGIGATIAGKPRVAGWFIGEQADPLQYTWSAQPTYRGAGYNIKDPSIDWRIKGSEAWQRKFGGTNGASPAPAPAPMRQSAVAPPAAVYMGPPIVHEPKLEEQRAVLHSLSPFRTQPIDYVRWVPIEKVTPNDYNPNSVARIEMALLYTSIKHDGYTQPIVTVYDEATDAYCIVDGFHRYYVMRTHQDIYDACGGHLPIVVIDKDIADRMASTIRHNRARGKHSVQGMSHLVFEMLQNGKDDADICNELGMGPEELIRLKHITGFSKLYEGIQYSKSWITSRQAKIARAYREAHATEREADATEREAHATEREARETEGTSAQDESAQVHA